MVLSLVTPPATEPLNRSGIYAITCGPTGRLYVGSAVRIAKRWNDHRHLLRHGVHQNPRLQAAWNKYGESAFSFHVLCFEECNELLVTEQRFMDELRATEGGFNLNPVAGSNLGRKFDAEMGRKISLAKRGHRLTPEHCAKVSASLIGNKRALGHRHSPETLALLRLRRVTGKPFAGHRHSAETKAKIGAAFRGKPLAEEHKQKIAAALKGTS